MQNESPIHNTSNGNTNGLHHSLEQERTQEESLPHINAITVHSPPNVLRRVSRKIGIWLLIVSSALAIFTGGLLTVYNKLDDKIAALSTVEKNDKIELADGEYNITLELHNITDVSDQIISLRTDLEAQKQELAKLQNLVEYQLNTTVKKLNETVEQVQQNVDQQVQEVNDNVSSQNSLMAYQFAGTFAILGSLISFWHMTAHIRKYHAPTVQRKIIAIMWMIPIYSVSSWLGLVFVEAQAYLSIFKDMYEAYAIYTFLSFLIAILGRGDREAVITVLAQHGDHLKAPIRMRPWIKGDAFPSARHKAEAVLDQCQFFTLQFVLLRPITTIVIVVCDAFHESRWDPKYPQFYVTMVVNISIFFAFTGLVRFYHVVKNDLSWCAPFSKFLCIKGVVFMTFWQGIVISFIAHAIYKNGQDSFTNKNSDTSATEWAKQAQSFLICLEMFLFAIVHCFVFPTEEWEPGYQEKAKRRIRANFGDSLALRDFVRDVKTVMRSKKRKGKKMQKLPQRDYDEKVDDDGDGVHNKRGNTSSLMMGDDESDGGNLDDSIDIDWSEGWGRIEQYLEVVAEEELTLEQEQGRREEAGGDVSTQNGMIEMQSRINVKDSQQQHSHVYDQDHDLTLVVEEGIVGNVGTEPKTRTTLTTKPYTQQQSQQLSRSDSRDGDDEKSGGGGGDEDGSPHELV